MSQAKVDRYKEEKANRKTIMKQEKRKHFLRKCVMGVVSLGLIGWIGFSAYDTYDSNRPRQEAEIDYSHLEDCMTKIKNGK